MCAARDDFVTVDHLVKPFAGGERDIAWRLRNDAEPLVRGLRAVGHRLDVEIVLHPRWRALLLTLPGSGFRNERADRLPRAPPPLIAGSADG